MDSFFFFFFSGQVLVERRERCQQKRRRVKPRPICVSSVYNKLNLDMVCFFVPQRHQLAAEVLSLPLPVFAILVVARQRVEGIFAHRTHCTGRFCCRKDTRNTEGVACRALLGAYQLVVCGFQTHTAYRRRRCVLCLYLAANRDVAVQTQASVDLQHADGHLLASTENLRIRALPFLPVNLFFFHVHVQKMVPFFFCCLCC